MAGAEPFPAIWLGGSLFVISVLVAGHFTPGYSHFHQSISELGEHSALFSGLVRWAGFVPFGSSFALYSLQTRDLFSSDIPSLIFLLTGLAIIIAGVFPTDAHNRQDTSSGKAHASAVISLLALLSLAPFAFSFPVFYRNPPADWFFVFSFSMGLLILGFLLVLPKGNSQNTTIFRQSGLGDFFRFWYPLQGLHQRILLSLYSIWWLVFSVVLT